MTTQQRYEKVLDYFSKEMPNAQSELNYSNPFELLVAVMLSAQCTDKRVNMVTPALFKAYPTAAEMAKATKEELLNFIHSVSYPNSKAEHLIEMSKRLVEVYHSTVPDNTDDLQTLSGVGRKTANVICAVLYNQPTMAVDTHIFRVSERIGLTTNSKNPLQTEKQLIKYIPADIIPLAHHWLLLHGRYICKAKNPFCLKCKISDCCRYFCEKHCF
ncbi:MAG: endonuclease III [Paludibacteraceae bacterium]|nr:endonuclease III [Paludibacteraceae bacterium]